MKFKPNFNKILSVIGTCAILFNSLAAPLTVLAQEITPTPEPTPEATPSDPVTPTPEATIEATATPEATPDATPAETITPTPEVTPIATDPATPAPSDQPIETQALESNPTTTSPPSSGQMMSTPEAPTENGQISATILENTKVDTTTLDQFDLSYQTDGSATISTDKLDYAPTDSVLVTGVGFIAGKTYTINIASSDAPAIDFKDSITANDKGEIIYSYQLDGKYRPNYQVEVKDLERVVATTTFTDSITYTDDTAGANDEPGQKDLTRLGRDLTASNPLEINWNWDVTSMPGSNTADGCALFDTNNNGLVNYSLCVTWDDSQNQVSGSPTLYSCNDTRVDRCASAILISSPISSTCNVANSADDPFSSGDSYPNDTKATCTIPLSDVGGVLHANLLDVCSYPSTQPNSDPSDCIVIRTDKGILTIVKDVNPDNANTNWNFAVTGQMNFNSSISGDGSSGVNSVDLGTYSITETAGANTSLTDYSTTWSCTKNGNAFLSGNGTTASNIIIGKTGNIEDSIVCTFTNTVNQGTLRVHKITDPSTDTTTQFSVTASGSGNINGNSTQTVTGGSFVDYEVQPGTYDVSEATIPGWSENGNNCSDVVVNPGQIAECTITNTQKGHIVVNKVTIGGDNTFAFTTTGSEYNGFSLSNGGSNDQEVLPGAYAVNETVLTGWGSDGGSCDQGETPASLDVNAGETVTCIFTNTKLPQLTVIKNLTPTSDLGLFDLQIDQTTYATDVTNGGSTGSHIVSIGQHSIGELAGTDTNLSDYNITYSANCLAGSVTLAAGDDIECTIYNTRKTGNVIIDKIVSGGTAADSDWIFTILNVGGSYHDGDQLTLNTGVYSISESTAILGYTLTSVGGICSNMSIPGATLTVDEQGGTCTFTNTRDTGSVKVNKQLDTNGDGTYDGGNTEANTLNFAWILDSGSNNAMGLTTNGVETTVGTTTHSVNEYNPGDYHFTGWYTNGSGFNCGNHEGNTLPISIPVSKDLITEITLCNARDTGSIEIVKNTTGGDDNFNYTSNFGVSSLTTSSGLASQTIDNLITGSSYNINEIVTPGWNLNSATCDHGTTSAIQVLAGHTTTCTFTNTKEATIIVKKVMDGGTDTFSYTGTPNGLISGNNGTIQLSVVPGQYVSTETPLAGWNLTNVFCSDTNSVGSLASHNATFNVEAGEIVTCTFTNTKLPTLTVNKILSPVGHGAFDLKIDGFTYASNVGNGGTTGPQIVGVGSHTVSEQAGNPSTVMGDYITSIGGECDPDGSISLAAGENKTCTITNTAYGSLIITKDAVPSSSQDFSFTTTGSGLSNFSLDDDADPTLSSSAIFLHLIPGTYGVSETPVSGWDLTNTVCNDGSPVNAINIGDGENVTCTFTNSKLPTFTVIKHVVNDNGGTLGADSFGIYVAEYPGYVDVSGSPTAGSETGTVYTLNPGEYVAFELSPPTGYAQTTPGCIVTLEYGENESCTITNNDISPQLTVIKHVVKDNGGNAVAGEFTMNVSGTNVSDSSFPGVESPGTTVTLDAGSYSVNEDAFTGYTKTLGTNCSGSISIGETKTCTITNDDQYGTLIVNKEVINDNGGTKMPYDFSFKVNDGDFTHFFDDINSTQGFKNLAVDAGIYSVVEIGVDGYSATYDNCTNVTVPNGGSATCTITNDDIAPTLKLVKVIEGGSSTLADWTLSARKLCVAGDTNPDCGFSDIADSVDFHTLAAGIPYRLFENGPSGYTAGSWSCDNTGVQGNVIVLGLDQETTCTITNIRDTGSITVIKNIDSNNDGDLDDAVDQTNVIGWTWDIASGEQNIQVSESRELDTGNYTITEDEKPGYALASWSCDNDTSGTTNNISLTLNKGDQITCQFTNTPLSDIHGYKWNDLNGNLIRDCLVGPAVSGPTVVGLFPICLVPTEPILENWTINLYKLIDDAWVLQGFDITDETGWYVFENLLPGDYKACEVQQDGWNQTFPEDNSCHEFSLPNGDRQTENEIVGPEYNFGNQQQILGVTIDKTNDKSGGASAGDTVNYTLVVANNGNQIIFNLDIMDALPGGFTYVAGSTTGDTSVNPSIAGSNLSWSDVDNEFVPGETFTLHYQVKIATDASDGLYVNWATCRGNVRSEQEIIECEPADSDVPIGHGLSFGGNLGQVLGISTELPGTGSPTALLALALGLITAGFIIKRKYVKN